MLNSAREVGNFGDKFKHLEAVAPSMPSSDGLKDALAAIALVAKHVERDNDHLRAAIDVLQFEASIDAMQQQRQHVEEDVVSSGFQHLTGK